MAQKKIDIKFNVDDKSVKIAGEETMKLSQQVRLLKAELASGKYSQEEFEMLASKLGDVQDQMDKAKTRSGDLLTSLQLIPGPVGEIASKFNGAVALLKQFSGFSLKDLKFQFKETLNDVKDIGKGLADATGLSALFGKSVQATQEGFSAVQDGVKGATTQVGNFRKALITTGIGAIVVAVGLLVAYWEDIVGLVNGVSSEQEELNALTQENLDIETKKLSDLDAQSNQLKLQGKSEREILQLKIQQSNQAITAAEAAVQQAEITKKAQVDAAQRNKDILSGLLNFVSFPLTAILGTIDLISVGLKELGVIDEALTLRQDAFDYAASFVFDPEEVSKEGEAAVQAQKDNLNKLKEQNAGFQLAVQEIDKGAAEKKTEKTKENNAKQLEAQKILADAELQLKSKKDQELAAVEADYQAKLLKLKEGGLVDDGKLKELYEKKKKEITDKYAADELKATEDFNKKIRDLNTAAIEDQLVRDREARTNKFNDDLAALEKDAEFIKKSEEEKNQIRKTLRTIFNNDINKIDEAQRNKEFDDQSKANQDKLRLLELEGQALIAGTEAYNQNRAEILKLTYDQELLELKRQLDTNQLTYEQYEAAVTATTEKNAQQRKELRKQEVAALGQTISSTLDAFSTLTTAIAGALDEESKNSRKAFEQRKKLQIATALISAASGVIQILTQPSTLPSPFDVITKTANALALGVATKLNIDKIKATTFESGGTDGGGDSASAPAPIGVVARRNQGGFVNGNGGSITDSIPAMLSNGEFVMNAKSASMFSPLLTAMNNMGNLPNTGIPQSLGNQSLVDVMAQTTNNRPIKTYVTAQDMSNQQQFDRTIKSRSLI
jgi:hypothetical protein